VVINAVGTVNGAEREVETIHEYTTFTSQHAVLTEDDLELKGSAEVLDDYAFVHSNSDILVTGQTQVDQTVSASGDITIQGVDAQLLGTPDILIGQPRVDIPYINPLDFRDDATIILTWDCKVLNALGTQIATADTNNKYRGWNCNQGTNLWTMGSAAGGPNPLGPLSAFYYVEGNVQVGSSSSDHSAFASTCSRDPVIIYGDVVSGSPTVTNLSDLELNDAQVAMSVSGAGIPGGTNVQSIDFLANTLTLSQNANLSGTNVELTLLDTSYCWKVTIVAEGNIVIGGDFDMQPYAPPLLFLAGNDLSLRGQASQSLDGLAAAHQEVDISGSMRLEGSVIAENGYWAAGQQVTTNRQVVDLVATNSISGQGQVVKKNESNTPFAKLVELAWRELVD
jgi:hypothetical protein